MYYIEDNFQNILKYAQILFCHRYFPLIGSIPCNTTSDNRSSWSGLNDQNLYSLYRAVFTSLALARMIFCLFIGEKILLLLCQSCLSFQVLSYSGLKASCKYLYQSNLRRPKLIQSYSHLLPKRCDLDLDRVWKR